MSTKHKNKEVLDIKLPPPINFSKLCKEIRKRSNATQQEMANLFGINIRSWQEWEAGSEPKGYIASKLIFLKNYFNIEDQDVFFEQEREKEIA